MRRGSRSWRLARKCGLLRGRLARFLLRRDITRWPVRFGYGGRMRARRGAGLGVTVDGRALGRAVDRSGTDGAAVGGDRAAQSLRGRAQRVFSIQLSSRRAWPLLGGAGLLAVTGGEIRGCRGSGLKCLLPCSLQGRGFRPNRRSQCRFTTTMQVFLPAEPLRRREMIRT